jgi:predicted RNA-binding Zn-ribbon protein involved in translation (DUF1610 family)
MAGTQDEPKIDESAVPRLPLEERIDSRVIRWRRWLIGSGVVLLVLVPVGAFMGKGWLVPLVLLGLVAFALIGIRTKLETTRSRLEKGLCPRCSADLRGEPADRPCPRCSAEHPLSYLDPGRPDRGLRIPRQLLEMASESSERRVVPPGFAESIGRLTLGVLIIALVMLATFLAGLVFLGALLIFVPIVDWRFSPFWPQRLSPGQQRKVAQRLREGHCGACGYNLRGTPTEHDCPECGQFNSQRLLNIAAEKVRRPYQGPSA